MPLLKNITKYFFRFNKTTRRDVMHLLIKTPEIRRSGRTLGGMLTAIGIAISTPGIHVDFIDHHNGGSTSKYKYMKNMMVELVEKLDLKMEISHSTNGLRIKSLHRPMYIDENGQAFQAVRI